ncbi:MAG: PEP-CTERM sorting domain-containing protein [Planctomycetes bacterium]|nr:PEP-CTERM sorting domain-containing protein [Planctomycetota bacterium]
MKKVLMLSLMLIWAVPASATVYTDVTGETLSNDIMDIASVEVTNTATDVSFAITLVGDIAATDWGKYLVAIDTVAGGDTASNAWGRNFSMTSGMDYFIGSWADAGGGAELYNWDGAAWAGPALSSPALAQFTTTITIPLASIGLTAGDSFDFDVLTTGGGLTDGVMDSLGNAAVQGDWGDATTTNAQTYVTPEPATLGLLAIGGVLALRRRRS